VRWSTDITDVKIFYGLLTQTARRQKIKIHPKTHYKNILKILGKQDVAALVIAEFSGKAIAANLITFFGDTAVYLHGGTNDKYHSMMSPHLLQWETILEASRRGCRYYDLGGCAVKIGKIDQWIGMTRFKAGFGGKLFQFGDTYDLVFNKKWYWLYQLKNRL
jgi:lipid II:glycine glycyltransferase (peptidoglycan interpeptide bridge formation enzyme)